MTTSIESGHLPANDIPTIREEQTQDFIQSIIDEHKKTVGFYRMGPNRPVLIPHKISMENILADQSHILIAHFPPLPPPPIARQSMNLSDLQHNRQQLDEVEFIQLLSSLVIRAIQVHRQYEKFVPGVNSPSFVTALSVSPAPLHASASVPSSMGKLPTIGPQRPTARQFAHIQSTAHARAAREGRNPRLKIVFIRNFLRHQCFQSPTYGISSLSSSQIETRIHEINHGFIDDIPCLRSKTCRCYSRLVSCAM